MSGSIHYGSDRRCTVAAAMGLATVLAVAGAVGCSTALYKASAVHPATGLTGTIPLSQLSGVKTSVPSVTPLVPRSLPTAVRSSDTPQGSPGFWPTAVVLTGVAAFIALYFQRNQERPLTAKPISMAAASGERLLWYPGAEPPEYLTGEYPGDRGFDPLGLSKDPDTFERMRIAEVFHCRLAMLGAVGCLVPELVFHRASWQDALEGADLNKVGAIAMQVIAPLEYWRGNGGFSWDGLDAGDRSYPGFDPLKLTTDETKLKEIKNGRLAMIAMLGFAVQNAVTGTGPLQNLAAVTGSVAMFASTGHKDGLWFPDATPPDHLTGEFPGDRGFDPLSLAADPETYKRMRVAEVFHCRLAMLGVVGVLIPELLGKGVWYEVGDASKALPNGFLFMCLCAPLEYWRGQGGFGWNKGDSDRSYPGFDPAKLTTEYTKVAEIKNGRLAMTAMLGFEVQHHLTGASPLANLAAHLADPLKVNITTLPSIAMF